jgi:hypothetical protein
MRPQTCHFGEEKKVLGVSRGEGLFSKHSLPQKSKICYHSFLYGTGSRLSFA